MVKLSKQSGFSMAEVLTVVLIMGIAAAIGLPQMFGEREGQYDKQALAVLDSGWESGQDFYNGQRGINVEQGPTNSFAALSAADAYNLNPDLAWQNSCVPSSDNQSCTGGGATFSPNEQWAKAVFVAEVGDQILGLCSVSRSRTYCRYDDGQQSGAAGAKRYGSRWGVSCEGEAISVALGRAKAPLDSAVNQSVGAAQAYAEKQNSACAA